MKMTVRWLILAGLIMMSLVFYSVSFVAGGTVFLVLGALFEMAFWFGLLESDKPSAKH